MQTTTRRPARRDDTLAKLRPPAELAQGKPCGTRIKYMGGCRCLPCRAANSVYSAAVARRKKLGNGNPVVPAEEARKHLRRLSKQGVGYKTVADVARVSKTTVAKILNGRRTSVRKHTLDRILAVTKAHAADRALIPAGPTWNRINWLLKEGFTKGALAQRLGYRSPALQIGKRRVTAATANKVERLYNLIRIGE